MTKLKRLGPIVVISALITLLAGAALATPSTTDFVGKSLVRASFGQLHAQHDGVKVDSTQRKADVAVAKVTIGSGGSSGWHHHPGVLLVSVKSGAVTRYDHQCHKTVYKAGEGWVESHDEPMLVRNRSKGDAVLFVTYLVPSSTTEEGLRIDDPRPKGCNVK
jgi:quercetin dioxygenase-like cupin family protein